MRLTEALGPPLGVGSARRFEARTTLEPGSTVVFYTDGLVERRDCDIDGRIDEVAARLQGNDAPVESISSMLVEQLCPAGSDDDIAVLVAHVPLHSPRWDRFETALPFDETAAAIARNAMADILGSWSVASGVVANVVLIASELVTNAVNHGRPPITLRVSRTTSELLLEVIDAAGHVPRCCGPDPRTTMVAGCTWSRRWLRNGGLEGQSMARRFGAPSRSRQLNRQAAAQVNEIDLP